MSYVFTQMIVAISYWVPPFGHLRINAYLLLPVEFRS